MGVATMYKVDNDAELCFYLLCVRSQNYQIRLLIPYIYWLCQTEKIIDQINPL